MQTYNTGGHRQRGPTQTACPPLPPAKFSLTARPCCRTLFQVFYDFTLFWRKRLRLAAVEDSMWNQFTMTHEFVFITFYRHKIVTPVCVVSNPCYKIIGLNLYKMFRKKGISCGGPCSFLPGVIKFQHFNAHCCHMDTAVQHPVPEWVKPLTFVIFDIRALWRSGLNVRVPGCQKLQMKA